MLLSNDQIKAFLAPNRYVPLVGLINKSTGAIILAPCIPPKVSLTLNQNHEATSGYFINADSSKTQKLSETNLKKINEMMKNGYVPRLAEYEDDDDEISAHMFLFKQHNLSRRSEWGGFGVSRNKNGELQFTYVSGAFNSQSGKRTKGARLDFELQARVIEAINNLVESPNNQTKENKAPDPNDGRTTPTNINNGPSSDEDDDDVRDLRNLLS